MTPPPHVGVLLCNYFWITPSLPDYEPDSNLSCGLIYFIFILMDDFCALSILMMRFHVVGNFADPVNSLLSMLMIARLAK